MGRKGRKNCRVIGRRRETSSMVNMAVFPRGPGDSMIVKEKMTRIKSSRY